MCIRDRPEMLARLADMGNMDTEVSTFHSFCKEVCEDHLLESGISTDSKLLKETSLQVWCMQNAARRRQPVPDASDA